MAVLVSQRCLHHALREAVARCPECGQFFCRECITEHDDRVICAACLQRVAVQKTAHRRRFGPLLRVVAAGGGLLVAWVFFFILGRLLVNIPAEYHEGTVWQRELEELQNPP